jgi:hypothetical protein
LGEEKSDAGNLIQKEKMHQLSGLFYIIFSRSIIRDFQKN